MRTADLFENKFLERVYNEYQCARMEHARLIGDNEVRSVERISPEAVLIRLLQQERNRILADIKQIKDRRQV